MARNERLEALLAGDLAGIGGLAERAMFGGWAWFLDGNLLCAASGYGMLARVGPEREAEALAMPGVGPMMSTGRRMRGWVRAEAEAFDDAAARARLLAAALEFTSSLPPKAQAPARRRVDKPS